MQKNPFSAWTADKYTRMVEEQLRKREAQELEKTREEIARKREGLRRQTRKEIAANYQATVKLPEFKKRAEELQRALVQKREDLERAAQIIQLLPGEKKEYGKMVRELMGVQKRIQEIERETQVILRENFFAT